MNAIVLTKYGPPEDLRLQEVPKPEPGVGEVLVKVRASAVNDWDWCYVRGKPLTYRLLFGLTKPKAAVLGAEVSGIVESAGTNVTTLQPGDEVYGDISEAGFGAFAEYVCLREDALCRKPRGMSFEQAAAIPHAAALARQGLIDVGNIQEGQTVLINGAGGGVGTIGVQIAKQYGCEVTGVDSAPKLEALRSIGFDHVIDYQRHDFTQNGLRYDLILDTKTNRSTFKYLRSLNPGGRYVTVGGSLPRVLQTAVVGVFVSILTGKGARVVALRTNKDLDQINRLFESGGLEVVIDGPYTLAEVPAAIRHFGEATHVGKVVIAISPT